jgi:UDP-N-acetylmuramate dehydrogenase
MATFAGLEHIVREQEPLAAHTWLRLGGAAQFFAEPTTVEELASLVRRCQERSLPVRVLGGGSNVLVRDEGVPGLVISLAPAVFGRIEVRGRRVTAGGGARLGHVISAAVREGLAGLEQLVGIPGTVGGALHTNAGTHGGDIGQCTDSATVLNRRGEIITRTRKDLRFGYRESSLDELAILEATFELELGDAQRLTKQMQQAWILKRAAEPLSEQNAGMMFKSPGGVSAADLIEQAGVQSLRVGECEISERNANFLVASSRATSREALDLIEQVRQAVLDRMGVDLELAMEVW